MGASMDQKSIEQKNADAFAGRVTARTEVEKKTTPLCRYRDEHLNAVTNRCEKKLPLQPATDLAIPSPGRADANHSSNDRDIRVPISKAIGHNADNRNGGDGQGDPD